MKRYSIRTTLSVAVCAAVLSGCAVTHQQDAKLTLAAGGQVVPAEEAAARYHLNPQWWTAYGDQGLNALEEQALANNVDLKQAALTVNKALYQANILGADLVPSFNGSLSGSVKHNLKEGGSSNSFGSQLGLSYELALWRKLSAAADAKVWEYQATQQDLAAARLTVLNNVADAYFQIAYLNEAMALTEKTIKQYREIHRITQAKYRYGRDGSVDPVQSEQNLLNAQNTLLSLQSSRDSAEQTLRNLLNLKPGEALAANPADFRLNQQTELDLNVPISVLANRPDLQAAEYRLQSSVQSLAEQKRSWYPSITLGASLSTSSDKASGMFKIPFLGGTASVNLPFLDWQTMKWNDKTAQANFDNAKLSFEEALTTALNEVNTNYRLYAHARQALAQTRQKQALAEKNSRYYQIRYQYGKNELADWLTALNTQYNSAKDLLNQRYEVLKYENMVYKAMGGRYTVPAATGR